MKTEPSNLRLVPLALAPLERPPISSAPAAAGQPARASLAAQVCNRTFIRDWMAGRTGQGLRRSLSHADRAEPVPPAVPDATGRAVVRPRPAAASLK
jgi:hypothetical protein